MSQKFNYQKLGVRVAEEAQLLAEERWILDTLNKIKHQRNCLQIERLQLESMKNQLRGRAGKSVKVDAQSDRSANLKSPVTFSLNMMQNMQAPKLPEAAGATPKLLEFEVQCNKEELNLNVTSSVFQKEPSEHYLMEEDDDENEENCEDLVIDMNMFMNSDQSTNNPK